MLLVSSYAITSSGHKCSSHPALCSLTTTKVSGRVLVLAAYIATVAAIDLSAATSYAGNSVVQIHNGRHCVYPDPYIEAPAPAACDGDIARIQHEHIYGNHNAASVAFYKVSTAQFMGIPPLYKVPNVQDVGVCLTGSLRSEYETRCWDIYKCPNADIDCTCGSRHVEGKLAFAHGCHQPELPTFAIVDQFMIAFGLA